MHSTSKSRLIFILGLLSAIGPFSIDMYLPGFPSIAVSLQTTVARVSLSLSSFFIGIAAGQMIYGPLLDRFGRKKPLYIGIAIYLLASVGCAFAKSVEALIWLRLLQALGSCSGMVASRAMVRDLFPVSENAKVFSLIVLVIGVSPIIAPTLGGYFIAHFGWHSVFIALSVLALSILVLVHFCLPESRQPDPTFSLKPKAIFSSYAGVAKEPQFYVYALAGSIAAAGLYAYIAGSPDVFMQMFKVSEQQYGWVFAGIACCLITSSQINTVLLKKYTSQQVVRFALMLQSFAGISLFALSNMGVLNVWGMIGLCALFLSCQGFTFPNTSALSLAPFTKTAGSASALLGTVQMAIGAFTSAAVSYLHNGTPMPMTGVMASCALSSFCIVMIGRRIICKKATALQAQEEAAEMLITS